MQLQIEHNEPSQAEPAKINFCSKSTNLYFKKNERNRSNFEMSHRASLTSFFFSGPGRTSLSAADTESDGCTGTGLEGARPEVRGIQPHAQRTRVGEAPSDTAGAEGGGETSATTRAGYAERVGAGRTDLGCFRSDGRACRMAEPPPGPGGG